MDTTAGTAVLQDRKVIIFGGSSGIGLAVAKAAAARQAHVIIISSNQQKINSALQLLPPGCKGFAVDVTKEDEIKTFFEKTGPFDHLVYTAGESLVLQPITDIAVNNARKFFNTRYWGAFTTVKYSTPFIRTTGSIVLTSGIASNRPSAKGWSLGASICAAMEGFTRAMALELAPVRVNIVSPGVVKTPLWSNMTTNEQEQLYAQMARTLPVGRAGTADDLARTYIYLMEQEYSTGQTIIADGGGSFI